MRFPIATLLLLALACATEPEDDLRAALPTVDTLSIDVPAPASDDDTAKPAIGELAPLYVVARRTSERLNGIIAHTVGAIAGAADGPLASPLSPAVYRLVAWRAADGVRYRLEGWPREAPGDVRQVAAGRASPDGRAGELHVDLAALLALDPAADVAGHALHIAYTPGALALALDGAHYAYAAGADGARFVFATDDGAIHAAWRPDGAGRAIVGDAGDGDAAVVECWDARFRRVFFAAPGGSEGDAAACVDVP